MKISSKHFKKAGIVLALSLFVGAITVFAQIPTYAEPSALPPTSSVPTVLNIGSSVQSMIAPLFALSLGANSYSIGSYLWDLEGSLTTLHVQQLCVGGSSGNCITSFPANVTHASIATDGSTCNGGWCAPGAFTGAKVCVMNGYSHLVGSVQGGSGGNVCAWSGGTNTWNCDSSCTTSCSSRTLTMVYCDNNGTSRLN